MCIQTFMCMLWTNLMKLHFDWLSRVLNSVCFMVIPRLQALFYVLCSEFMFFVSDFTDGISQSRKTGYDVRSGEWEMVSDGCNSLPMDMHVVFNRNKKKTFQDFDTGLFEVL